ncbi:MAG TPA: hypothetical protein VHU91_01865 [Mycobacteriales bacterium]|jgi:hypothetical protein|nr:hypothetical protein [Mycobacteriales bacterium]
MSEPVPLAATAREVAWHGDTADALTGLHRNKRLWHLGGWQLLALTAAGSAAGDPADVVGVTAWGALSYVPLAAPAAVIASLTYGVSKGLENRKVATAARRQQVVRDLLEEPVDLMVLRDSRHRSPVGARLALRWYGLDGQAERAHAPELAHRLARLLERTADTGIDTFVFGERGLSRLTGGEDGDFGRSAPGSGKPTSLTHDVTDPRDDARVRVATRAQCENALLALRRPPDPEPRPAPEDDIERILAMLAGYERGAPIVGLARRLDLHSATGLDRLAAILRRQLVADLDEGSQTVEQIDEDGTRVRLRSDSTVVINRGYINRSQSFRNLSGAQQLRTGRNRHLLTTTGHPSLESLVAAVLAPAARGGRHRTQAETALLLLVQRRRDGLRGDHRPPVTRTTTAGTVAARVGDPVQRAPGDTLYANLASARPLRTLRGRVRPGISREERPASRLEYYTRHVGDLKRPWGRAPFSANSRPIKAVAAVGIASVMFLIPWGGSKMAEMAHDNAVVSAVREVSTAVDEETIEAVERWLAQHMGGSAAKPPTVYEIGGGMFGIGDVPSPSNDVLFDVAGLDGSGASGYWYTAIGNVIDPRPIVSRDGPIIDGRHEVVADPVAVPERPAEGVDLRFSVTAPLPAIGGDEGSEVHLPVKSGTRLAALEITGANPTHADFSFQPQIYQDETGMYQIDLTAPQLRGISSPTLRYWLAPDPAAVPRAIGPMYVKSDAPAADSDEIPLAYTPLKEFMTDRQRARVLHALGLPPAAGDAEAFAAVQEHAYSFTPFADADTTLDRLAPGYRGATGAERLTLAGEAMAGLPADNCNLAMAAATLATGGRFDGQDTNVASGFVVLDDGMIRASRYHTWPVDQRGEIHDPTPAGAGPLRQLHAEQRGGPDLADNALELGSLLAAGAAWRRRDRIQARRARKAAAGYGRMLDGADPRRAAAFSAAVSVLNYLRWAPEGSPPPTGEALSSERPLEDRLRSQPQTPGTSYDDVVREAGRRGVKLDRRERKALRELTRSDSPPVRAARSRAGRSGSA